MKITYRVVRDRVPHYQFHCLSCRHSAGTDRKRRLHCTLADMPVSVDTPACLRFEYEPGTDEGELSGKFPYHDGKFR